MGGLNYGYYARPRLPHKMTGPAIISVEPKDLKFVYINGMIDLSQPADLPGNFGIPKTSIPDAQKGKAN